MSDTLKNIAFVAGVLAMAYAMETKSLALYLAALVAGVACQNVNLGR